MYRPTRLALMIALAALPCVRTTTAAEQYSSFYRPAAAGAAQSLFLGVNPGSLSGLVNGQFANGLRITDFEGYRNGLGLPRYDLMFESGPSGQTFSWGMSTDILVTLIASNLANGRHPISLSSWYDKFGGRRYCAAFSPASGGFDYKIGESLSEFVATFNVNASQGLWPTLSETYYDADGVRRWDTVYGDSSGTWKVFTEMNEAAFLNKIAGEAASGRNVAWFEVYRDKNLARRYTAMFNNQTPAGTFHLNQENLPFIMTYANEEVAGNHMLNFSVLIDVTDASWTNYGTGLAGTNGVPDLSLSEDPNIGQNIEVNIGNSRGVPTLCVFFTGLSATSIPLLGGEFLVNPLTSFSFIVPAGGVALPVSMPTDPALDGFQLYNQIVEEDPGAMFGVSISQGMKMTFGRIE